MNLFVMNSFDTSFPFVNLFRKQLLICLTSFMVLVVHNALAMFLLGHVHCCIRKRKNATLFSIWWCQANLSTIHFCTRLFKTDAIFWFGRFIQFKSFVYQNILWWFFIQEIENWPKLLLPSMISKVKEPYETTTI